jgi:TPR repeat protein
MRICRVLKSPIFSMRRPTNAYNITEDPVTSANTNWLSAHGKLWYDDHSYRLAWLIWPPALIAVFVILIWALPGSMKKIPWAKPADPTARNQQFQALRDKAKSDRSAMDQLERQARSGDMAAQFYYATLLDPNFKLSSVVSPDIVQSLDWYGRSAAQGYQAAIGNLAAIYYQGGFTRIDYTRACFYARKLDNSTTTTIMQVKGDCYSRGLGGTQIDLNQAAEAYELAARNGSARSSAALGYFYENGVGGKPRDEAAALRLYRAAADKGDSLGLHNLGFAYNAGTLGVQRDGGEAARLIYQALRNKYEVAYDSVVNRPQQWTPDFWQSLQHRLQENGLYSGPIDGRPNLATFEAIKRLSGQ